MSPPRTSSCAEKRTLSGVPIHTPEPSVPDQHIGENSMSSYYEQYKEQMLCLAEIAEQAERRNQRAGVLRKILFVVLVAASCAGGVYLTRQHPELLDEFPQTGQDWKAVWGRWRDGETGPPATSGRANQQRASHQTP
ncbi:MAG: hypothetical protein KDA60_11415 [Planctomycetales bacterium]|nr:hypothetical protein [Planctomycetales bacterium]